jgi:hypothetical protein
MLKKKGSSFVTAFLALCLGVVNGGALGTGCCLALLHITFSARGNWLALLHWHLVFRTRQFLLVIQMLYFRTVKK